MFKMNTILKTILLICLLVCSFYAFACEKKVINPPTESQIKQWWKLKEKEDDSDILKVVPIKLMNKETAFIAQVYFAGRGRNFLNGALLVRPILKEAREIDYVISASDDAFDVMDFDNDGTSEILTRAIGSGQGTTVIIMYLIRFEGWDPIVLRKSESGDNTGECGEYIPRECYETKVDWKFEDIDGDNTLDLIESIIEESWLDEKDIKSKKVVNNFLFKKGKLLPYEAKK